MQTSNIYLQNKKKKVKINCIMGNTFLTATANFEDFFKISSGEISPYVLKNNESSLKKIFFFF